MAAESKELPELVTVVSANVPRQAIEEICDWLAANDVAATAWEDFEGNASRIEIFLEDGAGADEALAALNDAGRLAGYELAPGIDTIRREEWSESWKRFFHTERVSPRLVVRPPWEEYQAAAGEAVVIMDPGMSFGTGQHGTTRACMQFIDQLAADNLERSLLDAGCGSGILAIAAAKLGFTTVCGYDNDPLAVEIATANALVNGVAVDFFESSLEAQRHCADIVVANILAEVLIAQAAALVASVSRHPAHALLLSGILVAQYAAVVEAYRAVGFVEQAAITIGEWRSGWFRRSLPE